MTSIYRLLRAPFSATPFDGEGSFRFGGRWSRPGTRVVYTAEHLSLAMIEYLVHLNVDVAPTDLVVATAKVPDDVSRVRVRADELPSGWRQYPPPEALADIGEKFVKESKAAVLLVPSALAVTENNWILNPAHADFGRIRLGRAEAFQYDPRLLRR